jgi:hypothetical protein
VPLGVRASLTRNGAGNLLPEIPDLPNQMIPYSLQGWIPKIRSFLKENEFSRNVFIMVSYRRELSSLIDGIKSALIESKLNPIVARDHDITDDLYNPIACLLCCSYGIAVFDRPQARQQHNPNVVYELGMMQLLKRPCVILKHRSLKKMPSDLLSRLYEGYSSIDEATQRLNAWWARLSSQSRKSRRPSRGHVRPLQLAVQAAVTGSAGVSGTFQAS